MKCSFWEVSRVVHFYDGKPGLLEPAVTVGLVARGNTLPYVRIYVLA